MITEMIIIILQAFGLMLEGSPFAETYLSHALVVLAGMYMFFVLERFLKFLRRVRKQVSCSHKTLKLKSFSINISKLSIVLVSTLANCP